MRALILMLLTSAVMPAHAGLLFEPYAGYTTGNIRVNGAGAHPVAAMQSLDTKGTIDGLSYGGRLGWTIRHFFFAADYQGLRAKEKLKGADESPAWNSTALFGVVGLQFFSGIRIYAGMTVNDFEATEDLSPDPITFKGSARKIGVGYQYRAPVAVNLEYTEFKFEDLEANGVKSGVKDSYEKLDYNAVILSISFPFYLGGG